MPRSRLLPVAAVAVLVFSADPSTSQPQPQTRFNYDGVIQANGEALDTEGIARPFDLEFRVFDHPDVDQARQVGPTIVLEAHPVTNGRVQAMLDFGAEIFQLPRRYLEVRYRAQGELALEGVFTSQLQIQPAGRPEPQQLPPPRSDEELLQRLEIARVVISDRQNPGNPHFLVDEQSFRQAYGVASPVTATDVASVAMVAASELRRQSASQQERIGLMEAEISTLRFRSNLAFLLLTAMTIGVLLNRWRPVVSETGGSIPPGEMRDEQPSPPSDIETAAGSHSGPQT